MSGMIYDHVKHNISEQKAQQRSVMTQSRSHIDSIYKTLQVKSHTGGEILPLENLMTETIRTRFLSIPIHQQITEEINFVNQASAQIMEQVTLYRVELGTTLQQIIEIFSVLFVKQFDVFNQTEN